MMTSYSPRILCITPNPAVDRTHVIPSLVPGAVHRSYKVVVDAGGKGINVARAVKLLGGTPLCAGFLGGLSGQLIAKLATADGLQPAWTWISDESRTCLIVSAEDNAESTVFNENGPEVSAADWDTLQSDVATAARNADIICISGSVPAGTPAASLPNLISELMASGHSVWVDTSKAALQSALNAQPTAIKVNQIEASEIAGVQIQSPAEAIDVARQFCMQGVKFTIITLGREGAVMASAAGDGWWAQPPGMPTVSAVASGDCFLAGMAVAICRKQSPSDALRHGVAAGTANALNTGGARFTVEQFEDVLACVQLQPMD